MSDSVLPQSQVLMIQTFSEHSACGSHDEWAGKTRLKNFEKPLKKLEIDTKNNAWGLDSHQVSMDRATFPKRAGAPQNHRRLARIPGNKVAGLRICNIAHEATAGPRPAAPPPGEEGSPTTQTAVARIWQVARCLEPSAEPRRTWSWVSGERPLPTPRGGAPDAPKAKRSRKKATPARRAPGGPAR